MSAHVGEAAEAFVFTGESGRTLWRGNFKLVKSPQAVAAIGAAGLHFHDLRHTRQHPRDQEADHGIADAIDQPVKAARRKPSKRKPKRAEKGDGPAADAS